MKNIRILILLSVLFILLGCSEDTKVKYETNKYIDYDYIPIQNKTDRKIKKSDVQLIFNQSVLPNHTIIGCTYIFMGMTETWSYFVNKGDISSPKWELTGTKESNWIPFLPKEGFVETIEVEKVGSNEYERYFIDKSKKFPLTTNGVELIYISIADAIDKAKEVAVENNCEYVYVLETQPSVCYTFLLATARRTPINKPKSVKK